MTYAELGALVFDDTEGKASDFVMPLFKENWQISWVELQSALRSQFSSLAGLTGVMRALTGVEQKEAETEVVVVQDRNSGGSFPRSRT